MKNFLATLLFIGGIILGVYLSIVVMFVGGITQIIGGLDPVNGAEIAWGIVKIIFCEVGFLPTYLAWLLAAAIKIS